MTIITETISEQIIIEIAFLIVFKMQVIKVVDFIPSPVLTIDDAGIAHGYARIARAGVYRYHVNELRQGGVSVPDDLQGFVGVFRPPDKVADSASLFADCPVILNHQWLYPENKEKLIKGWSGLVDYVNGWLESPITLFADDAINAAQTTHKGFSNGYGASFEYAPGQWVDEDGLQGEKGTVYDYLYIQVPVSKNHIALVENGKARAGEGTGFVTDSILFIEEDMKVKDMIPLSMGEFEFELPPDLKGYFGDMFSAFDAMCKDMKMTDTVKVSMGDESYMMPKSVQEAIAGFKQMLESQGKQSVTDSCDYVSAETYKTVEQKYKDTKASLTALEVQVQSLNARVQDATNPEALNELLKARHEAFKGACKVIDADFDPTVAAEDWKKRALVKSGLSSEVCDGYSPSEINSAFEVLVSLDLPKPTVTDKIVSLQPERKLALKQGILPQDRVI